MRLDKLIPQLGGVAVRLSWFVLYMLASNMAYAQATPARPHQHEFAEAQKLISDQNPFKLSTLLIKAERGDILFIGTNHTFDPSDPQITGIVQLYKAFAPTRVLLEGGNWPVAASKELAIRQYGEMGLTRLLAHEAGVKASSADAPGQLEVRHALKKHSPEEVKLYYALRMVPQWRNQQTGRTMIENMNSFLASASLWQNLPSSTAPNDVPQLREVLAKLIPAMTDWTAVQYNLAFNGQRCQWLLDVDRTVNEFRNDYMQNQILDAVRSGESVLVVAGNTHLAKIAPRLGKALEILGR
jgi:hypothetical protein